MGRRNDLINIFAPTPVCDPMGDQNIFHLNSQTDFSKKKFADGSVLVLSARLDTVNLFDKVEVGLDSPTSSIITLLSAAELMYRSNTLENEDKKVLFALLNGESFDYIGSSRMAYDMKENQFPAKRQDDENVSDERALKSQWPNLDFKSILAHIELGQVISHENANLFAHVHNTFDDQNTLEALVNEGQKVDLSIVKTPKKVLPPSSIQSLLKEDTSVPGILLSNFDESYTDFVKPYNLPDYPLPQYVGVERSKTYHTLFTHRLLVYLTSKPLEGQYSTSNCTAPNNQTVYDLIYMNGVSPPSWWNGTKEECEMSSECGFCYNTTAWLAPAVSPAFIINEYDFHNNTYAAWSESSWQDPTSRMFLKANPARDRGYFALGIFMLVLSFVAVIWLEKFGSDIFQSDDEAISALSGDNQQNPPAVSL